MPRGFTTKNHKYLYLILLFIVSLISLRHLDFYKRQPMRANGLSAYPKRALVTRVIDGDTIVIKGGLRVRYIGIDTPETKHPEKGVEYYGREAAEFNRSLVANKEVSLEYDVQKVDKYGRLLAYVYADDIFINAKLVEEGYAQIFTVPPNVRYANLFLSLQRNAGMAKKGLWSKTP
jgi:micrococcal nuclease